MTWNSGKVKYKQTNLNDHKEFLGKRFVQSLDNKTLKLQKTNL
jgi:hypothetical protein